MVAQLHFAAAFFAEGFFEFKTAFAAGERALASYQKLGDQRGILEAQRIVGVSLVVLGRSTEGEPLLREALDAAREMGKRHIVARLLVGLGFARSVSGDLVGARAHYSEALRLFGTIGAEWSTAMVVFNQSGEEARAGDVEGALQLALEATTVLRGLNRMHDVMHCLNDTACYLVALARYDEARACAREALHLALDRHWAGALAFSVQHLVAVDALQTQGGGLEQSSGVRTRAARLLGFVNAKLETLGTSRDYMEHKEWDKILTGLRGRFNDLELAELFEIGAAMTDNEAIEEALKILPSSNETIQVSDAAEILSRKKIPTMSENM